MLALTIGHRTSLAVACPHCGDLTETPLASLKWTHSAACKACGHEIDVSTGEIRQEIDTLFEVCRRGGF
jgi:transcription elongation factor Elf1